VIALLLFSYLHALPLKQKIHDAAIRSYLDPKLVESIIEVESNKNEKAISPKGARGLMQLMPNTQRACGVQNAFHSVDSLMGACECIRKLMNEFKNDLKLVLAAYNAGIGNVKKYKGVPPFKETRNYVRSILDLYQAKKNSR
jgi:soluble lytic murein transglycosylase-like protein